jgi:hypothetical protein
MSELLSQLDIALQQTELDTAPTTTALITEVHRSTGGTRRIWPSATLRDGRAVPATNKGLALIASCATMLIGKPVVIEAELEMLCAAGREMRKLIHAGEKYSLGNINKHLQEHRDKLQVAVLEGADMAVIPSRESVALHFRQSQQAIVAKLVKLTHEVVMPTAQEVLARFGETLEKFLRQTEEQDRAACQDFGLEYQPSLPWQSAATALMTLSKSRVPESFAWSLPSSILAGIVEL